VAAFDGLRQSRFRGCLGEEGGALADRRSERLLARQPLAPRRRGVALGRQCDSPAQAGPRTKAVVPSSGRTRLDLGECTSDESGTGSPAGAAARTRYQRPGIAFAYCCFACRGHGAVQVGRFADGGAVRV
jgi:hypothetical protein